MSKHTIKELQELQALPLNMKISLTYDRLRDWVNEYGEDGVYLSYSGGKDSTVLLYLIRKRYPTIKAVFYDTHLEFPELRQFVKLIQNVDVIQPDMSFKQVVDEFGYPMLSKEIAECVCEARKYLTELAKTTTFFKTGGNTEEFQDGPSALWNMLIDEYETKPRIKDSFWDYAIAKDKEKRVPLNTLILNSERLKDIVANKTTGAGKRLRLARLLGMVDRNNNIRADIPDDEKSDFNHDRYAFMLVAPFEISSYCCNVFKKHPAHRYARTHKAKPITAQMASESRLRLQKWLMNGCNAFDVDNPISNPMSFWTESDILLFIHEYWDDMINWLKQESGRDDITRPVCSVYGDLVLECGGVDGVDPCTCGMFDPGYEVYRFTGYERTGCFCCGFGLQVEEYARLPKLAETHPQMYQALMKPVSEHGCGYKDKLDWINEFGCFEIQY